MATNPGTTGLISYWSLDETSGSRADSHGSNTLTDNNTVGYASGKQGNAADFELSNGEYLSITDAAQSGLTLSGDFALACWCRPESFPTAGMLMTQDNFPDRAMGLYVQNAGSAPVFFVVGSSSTGVVISADGLSVDTWHFVVAWHDSTAQTISVQVDGGAITSVAHTTGTKDAGADFQIGGRQYSPAPDRFDGLIDEASAWSRVLTSGERAWLYNSGAGRTYAELSGGGQSPVPLILQAHHEAGWL